MITRFGKLLCGYKVLLESSYQKLVQIPVDLDLSSTDKQNDYLYKYQQTIEKPVEVSGPGTFNCKKIRTLRFEPTDKEGWWFKRTDISDAEPVQVACNNTRTEVARGVRNIVLDGPSCICVRLIEHIIALKVGLDIDNLLICIDSDDPPLFESGSITLIDALNSAGRKKTSLPCKFFTVKETVAAQWSNGSFLTISPADPCNLVLNIDCTINFDNAMGKQRLKLNNSMENFKKGAEARTNTNIKHAILCKTIGKIFPSTRHLGYNKNNVLIAGQRSYYNTPRLIHDGKALEAVWHRLTLDLLAAVALISEGRFLGNIVSYKAGHREDVEMIQLLNKNDMLTPILYKTFEL